MNKTRKNIGPTKGWKHEKPGFHQRTVMLKKCGKKCFLGSRKSFPICKKNTCKISTKGVYAAYIRANNIVAKEENIKTFLQKQKKYL